MFLEKKISVVIPSYKVTKHILEVVKSIPSFVDFIIVVDDKCPENSGRYVLNYIHDERVIVLFHDQNQGVGGAVLTGYLKSLELHADIAVKIDGDGQMDSNLISEFIRPICEARADYTKGNRFFWPRSLQKMPLTRVIGNSGLSFINKVSSGYWNIMDPTNGFTAIDVNLIKQLNIEHISKRFFFESDMLYRLYLIRAVVQDIPMIPLYADEISNLKISSSLIEFSIQNMIRVFKRIVYMYFIRDFNAGTLYLLSSIPLILFSMIYGGIKWAQAYQTNIPTPVGTLLIVSLPLIFGFHLFINFLTFDTQNIPSKAR